MDSTLGILREGYPFFQKKFEKQNTDVLKTRLLLRKTLVVRGEEGAEIFYDQQKFKREGATPSRFKKTLFGKKGVQGLDGKEHVVRKKLFMQCMSRDSISSLQHHFEVLWRMQIPEWRTKEEIVLFDEVEKILTQAGCQWVGVPLPEKDIRLRTNQLSELIDSSGGVGLRHYKGRRARKKAEKWIEALVDKIRKENKQNPEEASILGKFSLHRDLNGKLLDKKIVAVEILNLIRPIVAIARYIVFSAMALHEHPQYYKRLRGKHENLDLYFVQEVRRFYPFFPFVAAMVKEKFSWNGVSFKKGRRVLLDLYATNHDERNWTNAGIFYPERFADWDGSAFNFIPQGGGDHNHNHRCAGEWITINITRAAINLLVKEMDYEVPKQDLQIKMSRIPAIPGSRFRMNIQ
ncbi:cytochrome P450 [Zunongwangia sp. F363]|uniref:Cytochrome P450 n=1 Tax=Autumnicola tepida TaxID=3075595 RepID=A0ABU3CB65_9FLAO|nr:cytochrome P450 [Zunongwangia sp. F363]MDT0643498.1 cytochrome P450 [Zunongwangia sp. F363]